MSSASASGRSNGSRLVSANAATVKMKYASASGNTFHVKSDGDCFAITSVSVTLPARSSTATVLIPIAISYEIICAEARSPPSSEYLLLDDHPASTIPYTPSELIARIYRKPTGRSATTIGTTPHGVGSGAANGITANVSSAGTNEINGASVNNALSAWAGSVSSFRKFFRPSAAGWSNPWGPTRF